MEFLKTPFCNMLLFVFQFLQNLTFFQVEKFAPGPISPVPVLFFQGFSKIVVFVFFWFYLKFEIVYFGAALLTCLRFFSQPLKCCLVKREATNFLFYFSNQITS